MVKINTFRAIITLFYDRDDVFNAALILNVETMKHSVVAVQSATRLGCGVPRQANEGENYFYSYVQFFFLKRRRKEHNTIIFTVMFNERRREESKECTAAQCWCISKSQ